MGNSQAAPEPEATSDTGESVENSKSVEEPDQDEVEEEELNIPEPPTSIFSYFSFQPTQASKAASQALHKQFSSLMKRQPEKEGFRVEMIDNNLYKWHVHLFDFPPDSPLAECLLLYNLEFEDRDSICLEIIFPSTYPSYPPFMRVLYPRFHNFTGHITAGGSICVEDLTLTGWKPEYELYQFIIMIRNLLMEGGALVNLDDNSDYSEAEAKEAFLRVAKYHGWKTA